MNLNRKQIRSMQGKGGKFARGRSEHDRKRLKTRMEEFHCFFCGIKIGKGIMPVTILTLSVEFCPQCAKSEKHFLEEYDALQPDFRMPNGAYQIHPNANLYQIFLEYKTALDEFNAPKKEAAL